MQKITLKYSDEAGNAFEETIADADLEEECELWLDVCHHHREGAETFAQWWEPGTYHYPGVDVLEYEDHGLKGWLEGLFDNIETPLWLVRAREFKIEVTVE